MNYKIRLVVEIILVVLAILVTIYNIYNQNKVAVTGSVIATLGTIFILLSDLKRKK